MWRSNGDIFSHMAPSCRGDLLDRRDDLFVAGVGAGAQVRTVRSSETPALPSRRQAVSHSGLGRDRGPFALGAVVTASAGNPNQRPSELANGVDGQAGARDVSLALDSDPRSYPRASRREDCATSHGAPNQFRPSPGSLVSLGRALFPRSDVGDLVCRGPACAKLEAWFIRSIWSISFIWLNQTNRLLTKAASGVLAARRGSTYCRVRLAPPLAAALLDGRSEQPVTISVIVGECSGMRIPAAGLQFVKSLLGP